MRVIFFGTDHVSVKILEFLLKDKINVVAVVTGLDKKKGRGLKLQPSPVKSLSTNIKTYQTENPSSDKFVKELYALKPDCFVVASYGHLLKQNILDVPTLDSINVHPSILPKYRGPSPVQSAILAGDVHLGVTIMRMVLEMDAGDILKCVTTEVLSDITYGEAEQLLVELSREPLISVLRQTEETGKRIKGIPQDHFKSTYTKKIYSKDSFVNWQDKNRNVCNFVRGMNPRPIARTYVTISGIKKLLKIYQVKISNTDLPCKQHTVENGKWIVGCKEGSIELIKICLEGKSIMSAREFLNGLQQGIVSVLFC